MLSKEQYIEKQEKVKKVVIALLNEKKTIKQMSEDFSIPKSSVQRYLNDNEFIKDIFGVESEFIIEEIRRKLGENYKEGKKIGGQTYALNNQALQDESGHFIGSRKK